MTQTAQPYAATQRLQIVGIDPERNFGGGETQVMGLTHELLRMGHRAELVCDPKGELWKHACAEQIICHPLRVRNSIDLIAGLRLRAILSRGSYDVVHFHTARAHSLAPFSRKTARIQVVTRRMDYPPNRYFGPYLYNRAVDRVIAISAGVAEAVTRGGVARHRLRVVPSGVDCARFVPPDAEQRAQARTRFGLDTTDLAIGAIGALVPRKGHRVLLDAMALAGHLSHAGAMRDKRIHCLIAGAGPSAAELAGIARELSGQHRVTMLGALDDPRSLLGALDLFAMPSLNEGLGVAALEAMASGIPVIASAVGGLCEAVVDGTTGRLVRRSDASALAEAIMVLAQAPDVRIAMGAAGRTRALDHFSMQAMARRTLDVYSEALAGH